MATKKMVPIPASLATDRCMEKVRPGMWWLGQYEDGNRWIECNAVLTYTHSRNGSRQIELRGVGTDDEGQFSATFRQVRDYVVSTLTAAQARRCGLGS